MDHRGSRGRSRKHQAPRCCWQQGEKSVRDITGGKGPQNTLKRDLYARSLAIKDGDSVSAMSSTWYNRELVETANSLNTETFMFPQSPSLPVKEMTIAELADFEAENGESELHRQRMLACERRIRYQALIGETVEGEKVCVCVSEVAPR